MNLNADLVARHLMRMAAEFEALAMERDALLQENEQLKAEMERRQSGPRPVPAPTEERPA